MSKYTAEQVLGCAEGYEALGEPLGASMLRAYAATLSQQAEWPSDEDVVRACRAYNKAMGIPAVPSGFATPHMMRAALQSVRPPVGVVSDEDVERSCVTFFWTKERPGAWPHDHESSYRAHFSDRMRAALESYASRHVPTKE